MSEGIAASKNNLVHELFVRTADENHVTARWCTINWLTTNSVLHRAMDQGQEVQKVALLAPTNTSADMTGVTSGS